MFAKLYGCARCLLVAGLFVLVSVQAQAAEIHGTVTDPQGKPVANARVTLIELHRSVFSDDQGVYRFEDVPMGSYHLQALRSGLGSAVAEFDLEDSAKIDLALNFSVHREKIVVSSNRSGVGTHESIHPVTVLERDELLADMQPTLGEIVAEQAGISSTFFGAGSSRPVIRGQQGSRVKILESGLDGGDASSTSPDHAVGADPFEAERIEILRGPSVLLYGSSATGGAVNVIDQRIPEFVPAKKIGGELNLRYGSAAEESAGGLKLHGGSGQFAWQLSGFARDGDDYDIPESGELDNPASPRGTVVNSYVESSGGSVGGSWISDRSFFGVSVKTFNTEYGIPPEDPDELIFIDLEQERYDLRGGHNFDSGVVRGLRFQAGATDYEHVEFEDGAPATRFFNESFEGRFELLHGRGDWKGVVGVQVGGRDFEAIGDEAFLPPSTTDSLAVFSVQERTVGDARFEFGLRVDSQDTEAAGAPRTDFDGVSASGGVSWNVTDRTSLSASASRSTRFPVAEELYSDGPHHATESYEIGDPTLDEETGLGVDLGVRHTVGRVSGELHLFATDYEDYIFETPTGAVLDDLPVFQFGQADAEFYGYELTVVVGLIHDDQQDFDLHLSTDSVRATLDGGGQLPLLPPRSHKSELSYRRGAWKFGVGIQHVEAQDRIAAFETRTPSHTLVDASAGYTLVSGGRVHQFLLRGRNLTDEDARIHASRLKLRAPLPGADISLDYRLVF